MSRRYSRVPQAFFNRKKSNRDQSEEDFLASSWGGEQPDWIESPDQRDVLDEVWYEVSGTGALSGQQRDCITLA